MFAVALGITGFGGSRAAAQDAGVPPAPEDSWAPTGSATRADDPVVPPTATEAPPPPPPQAAPPPPAPQASPPPPVAGPPPPQPTRQPTQWGNRPTQPPPQHSTDQERNQTGRDDAPHHEPPGPEKDLLWIEAIGGASYIDLLAVSTSGARLAPTTSRTNGYGPSFGVAAALRFEFIAIGARGTFARYDAFDVGTVGGDVTLRVPGFIEPWLRVGAGYGWVGRANDLQPELSQTQIYGFVFQGGVGVDFFLGSVFVLGIGADVDVLNLSRQRVEMAPMALDVDLSMTGNAVGVQGRAHLTLGIHFIEI